MQQNGMNLNANSSLEQIVKSTNNKQSGLANAVAVTQTTSNTNPMGKAYSSLSSK